MDATSFSLLSSTLRTNLYQLNDASGPRSCYWKHCQNPRTDFQSMYSRCCFLDNFPNHSISAQYKFLSSQLTTGHSGDVGKSGHLRLDHIGVLTPSTTGIILAQLRFSIPADATSFPPSLTSFCIICNADNLILVQALITQFTKRTKLPPFSWPPWTIWCAQ